MRAHASSPDFAVWKLRLRTRHLKLIMGCVECNVCKVLAHTHTHTHRSPSRTGPCTLNAVGLLSLDVETRGSPPPLPHHLVCVEKFTLLTLPYLRCMARSCIGLASTLQARREV